MTLLTRENIKPLTKYVELISIAVEQYIEDHREIFEEALQYMIEEHLEENLPIEDADVPSWLEHPEALNHEMDVVLADLNVGFKLSIVKQKIKKNRPAA